MGTPESLDFLPYMSSLIWLYKDLLKNITMWINETCIRSNGVWENEEDTTENFKVTEHMYEPENENADVWIMCFP